MTLESPPILKLLGGAVILSGDEPLGGPAAHRHRLALLAMLALSELPISRDKLIAYLWPERDTERARNLLKTNIHELRKLLGDDAIRATGDALSLDQHFLRCDVTEFERAVKEGDLERAASAYTGAFLDGFFIKESTEFEEWASGERARLARIHEGVAAHAPNAATLRITDSPLRSAQGDKAAAALGDKRVLLGAAALVVAVVAFVSFSHRGTEDKSGPVALQAVTLRDGDPGTALGFDGATATASTPLGTTITSQVDDIAYDVMVRYDGRGKFEHDMIVYNGHGAVSGWGVMVLGRENSVADGTVALLAGGISVTATPLVLKRGVWQHLLAERRDGRVTVTLDGRSYSVGKFPVNPIGADANKAKEHTSVGGDGTFEIPSGTFRGAIDRLVLRDLKSGYSVDRWGFDEGHGTTTVGINGGVLTLGATKWVAGAPFAPGEVFWLNLQRLCNHAFGGRLVDSTGADSALIRGPLTMYPRACSPTEMEIDIVAGTDRSRTLVVTRTEHGFSLRHELHAPNGQLEKSSGFGGATKDTGTFTDQRFIDAKNEWTVRVKPDSSFAYSWTGPSRRMVLDFDLQRVVAKPPPAWGK